MGRDFDVRRGSGLGVRGVGFLIEVGLEGVKMGFEGEGVVCS